MIKVQNLSTSEVINVLNVVVENGQIISEARRPHKGARFYSSYPMMVAAGESEDGRDLHTLAEGWVLASKGAKGTGEKKECKPRQPKQEAVVNTQAEEVEEVVEEVTEQHLHVTGWIVRGRFVLNRFAKVCDRDGIDLSQFEIVQL